MPNTSRDHLASSRLFDATFYLEQYPDVAEAGVDPIEHYLDFGWREGRRPSPVFDGDWYLRQNPDVAQAGVNPLVHYLGSGRLEGRRPHKRVAVYTAIIGNYDQLRPPLIADPDVEYIAFVDDWVMQVPAPWIRRAYRERHGSDRLTARFIKTHPHVLLPEFELSVWVDGAFQIRTLNADVLSASLDGRPVAFFAHPDRDCAYDEARTILKYQLDDEESVGALIDVLKSEGHPPHAGLLATGVIVRRHGDLALSRAMERWWALISTRCGRDQLSIDFVLKEAGVTSATLPGSVWRNDLVEWVGHGPTPWKGLQCGGAYLDAEEYQAIETMTARVGIKTAVETGAGETSKLFKLLGVQTLSIESAPGPWSERALSHGCMVVAVQFDRTERQFRPNQLRLALAGLSQVDLVFIDSPIGAENRRGVLSQILDLVRTRYVLYHDVRRDLRNIFADQARHGLRMVDFVDSPRGLALFAVGQ